jgi:hypothetical protein
MSILDDLKNNKLLKLASDIGAFAQSVEVI